MRILDESSNFLLWHEFEEVWLTDKRTDRKLYIGRHYGDPVQGIIGPDESWFLTAGEGLLFLDFSRKTHEFLRGGMDGAAIFVHSMRVQDEKNIRVLLDPWSDYPGTMVLHIDTLTLERISEGPSLKGEPWREEVDF
jgi:hypothetical protein